MSASPIRCLVADDHPALLAAVSDFLETSGFILKDAPLSDLAKALEAICAGRRYVDPALARVALGASAKPALTPRESEVLAHVADGLSHDEIGRQLSISPETVRTHVRKACERLNARTRTHAVATALRLGLFQ